MTLSHIELEQLSSRVDIDWKIKVHGSTALVQVRIIKRRKHSDGALVMIPGNLVAPVDVAHVIYEVLFLWLPLFHAVQSDATITATAPHGDHNRFVGLGNAQQTLDILVRPMYTSGKLCCFEYELRLGIYNCAYTTCSVGHQYNMQLAEMCSCRCEEVKKLWSLWK